MSIRIGVFFTLLIGGSIMAKAQPVVVVTKGSPEENLKAQQAEQARRLKAAQEKVTVTASKDGKQLSIVQNSGDGGKYTEIREMTVPTSNRLSGTATVDVVRLADDMYEYTYVVSYAATSQQPLAMISFPSETMEYIEFQNVPADMSVSGRSLVVKASEGTRNPSITFRVRSKLPPGDGQLMLTGKTEPPKFKQEATFDPDVQSALLAKGGLLTLENPANSHIIKIRVPTIDQPTIEQNARMREAVQHDTSIADQILGPLPDVK